MPSAPCPPGYLRPRWPMVGAAVPDGRRPGRACSGAGVDVAAGGQVAALDELDLVAGEVGAGALVALGRSRARPASGHGRGGPGGRAPRRTPRAPARAGTARPRATRATTSGTRSGRSTSDSRTNAVGGVGERTASRPQRGAHALGPVVGHHDARRSGRPSRSAAACSASAPSTTVTRRQPPSSRFATPRCSQDPRSSETSAFGVPIRRPAPAASSSPSTRPACQTGAALSRRRSGRSRPGPRQHPSRRAAHGARAVPLKRRSLPGRGTSGSRRRRCRARACGHPRRRSRGAGRTPGPGALPSSDPEVRRAVTDRDRHQVVGDAGAVGAAQHVDRVELERHRARRRRARARAVAMPTMPVVVAGQPPVRPAGRSLDPLAPARGPTVGSRAARYVGRQQPGVRLLPDRTCTRPISSRSSGVGRVMVQGTRSRSHRTGRQRQ